MSFHYPLDGASGPSTNQPPLQPTPTYMQSFPTISPIPNMTFNPSTHTYSNANFTPSPVQMAPQTQTHPHNDTLIQLHRRIAQLETQLTYEQNGKQDALASLVTVVPLLSRSIPAPAPVPSFRTPYLQMGSPVQIPMQAPVQSPVQFEMPIRPAYGLMTQSGPKKVEDVEALEREVERLRKENRRLVKTIKENSAVKQERDDDHFISDFRAEAKKEEKVAGSGSGVKESNGGPCFIAQTSKLSSGQSVWGSVTIPGDGIEGNNARPSFTTEKSNLPAGQSVWGTTADIGFSKDKTIPTSGASQTYKDQQPLISIVSDPTLTAVQTTKPIETDPDPGFQTLDEVLAEPSFGNPSREPSTKLGSEFPVAQVSSSQETDNDSGKELSTTIPETEHEFDFTDDERPIDEQLADHEKNLHSFTTLPTPTVKKVGFVLENSFRGKEYLSPPPANVSRGPRYLSQPLYRREFNDAGLKDLGDRFDSRLWGSKQDRDAAFEFHNIICARTNELRCPDLFLHGLQYRPYKSDTNYLRTVHISNLPSSITLKDVLARVRGGAIFSATLMDAGKKLGGKSARIVFKDENCAEEYVEYTSLYPVYFGSNKLQPAEITLLSTPTYPIPSRMLTRLQHQTRCFTILNFPKFLTVRRLEDFLYNGNAHKQDGLLELWFDKENNLHLEFSSVDMAGQAWGIIRGGRLGLDPGRVAWENDPCAGDVEELAQDPITHPVLQGEHTRLQPVHTIDDDEVYPVKQNADPSPSPLITKPEIPSRYPEEANSELGLPITAPPNSPESIALSSFPISVPDLNIVTRTLGDETGLATNSDQKNSTQTQQPSENKNSRIVTAQDHKTAESFFADPNIPPHVKQARLWIREMGYEEEYYPSEPAEPKPEATEPQPLERNRIAPVPAAKGLRDSIYATPLTPKGQVTVKSSLDHYTTNTENSPLPTIAGPGPGPGPSTPTTPKSNFRTKKEDVYLTPDQAFALGNKRYSKTPPMQELMDLVGESASESEDGESDTEMVRERKVRFVEGPVLKWMRGSQAGDVSGTSAPKVGGGGRVVGGKAKGGNPEEIDLDLDLDGDADAEDEGEEDSGEGKGEEEL